MMVTMTQHPYNVKAPRLSFLLPVLLMSFFAFVTSSCPAIKEPTEDLRGVVKGRCIEYTTIINPQAFCDAQANCTKIADAFISAIAYLDPCQIDITRYDEFLSLASHHVDEGKIMFWSGTYSVAHDYSKGGKRVFTLEDTLPGYLIDSLHFCSSPDDSEGIGGPATTYCPAYYQTEGCTWNAEASFWIAASKNFATRAKGVISVMLNASREEAFRTSSYFGGWEYPNFREDAITRVDIVLVNVPGDVIQHTCQSDNIGALESELHAKNIPTTCTSNPPDLEWMMCLDRRDEPECQALSR